MHEDPTAGRGEGLQAGLKQRHMTMISLGGVIGAGPFVSALDRFGIPGAGTS